MDILTAAEELRATMSPVVPERIALVIPPSGFLLDDRVFMSLGILRVGAVLERAGAEVEMLDLSGISNYLEAVRDMAGRMKSNVFALTATTPQLPPAAAIMRVLREVRPDAKCILGGPHATLVNAAAKGEKKRGLSGGRGEMALRQMTDMFDVTVCGDGERAVFLACHPHAPKLVDADDPASPLFLTDEGLDELPWPARHLVDVESYRYAIDGAPALSLIAQLGCPYECGFCGGRKSAMLRRIRMRTSKNIVAEMEHIWRATGRTGFMLYDDELNVNRGMVDLMRQIRAKQDELGVEWKLRGFIKSNLFTDEQARAMHDAGFRWILIGFESGSERILTNINKKATRAQNTRCMEIAHRHGLKVKALMSVGHPGESPETLADTRDWLLEVRPADFDVTIITCYPGTPYYDEAVPHSNLPGVWTYTFKRTGDRLHQVEVDYTTTADYYKGDPEGGYQAYVFTDALPSEDLVRGRDHIERSVRETLGIPFNPSAPSVLYEHSMGQGGLPPFIYRTTHPRP